jgi:hypothetical protein
MEARVISKVSRRIVPFVALCYFVCYLDRVNVGFAALQMNSDLGFTATIFGWGCRDLLLRLLLLRSAKQFSTRALRGAALDCPDHGDLGAVVGRHGADLERMELPCRPVPARRGRSRLLSRNHSVPDLLVPCRVSRSHGWPLHGRDPDFDGHRRAGIRADPWHGRDLGAQGLGMAVYLRGLADGSARSCRDVLSYRWSR